MIKGQKLSFNAIFFSFLFFSFLFFLLKHAFYKIRETELLGKKKKKKTLFSIMKE